LLRSVPDLEIAITKEHVSRDAVIIECLIRGTHGGAWRGLPATGRRLEFPLCGVFREPTSLSGRLLLLLDHPLNILSAWLRGSGRSA
jgi:hypothetical protein